MSSLEKIYMNHIKSGIFQHDPLIINTLPGAESLSLFCLFIFVALSSLYLLFFYLSYDSVVWKDPGPGVSHLLKASCLEREVI